MIHRLACISLYVFSLSLLGCGQEKMQKDLNTSEKSQQDNEKAQLKNASQISKQSDVSNHHEADSHGKPSVKTRETSPQNEVGKRNMADLAGKWKSRRYELDLKADGQGSGIYDEPSGGFTAERATVEFEKGGFVLSFLRTKSFALRKWNLTLSADKDSLEMTEINGDEKGTLKRMK